MIRRAKTGDHWRVLNKGNSSCHISELTVSVDGHIPVKVALDRGVSAFIGRNGSRKTTLIRGVYQLLNASIKNRELAKDRDSTLKVADGVFSAEGKEDLVLSSSAIEIGSFLFDPCSTVPELRSILRRDENFDDLFEGGSLKQLDQDGLRELEQLTGNKYNSVSIIEVDDENYNSEFPRFPLFKLKRDELHYDSRDMGYGELSILLFYWIIQQIISCREDYEYAVLFMEEPESFISPEFQKRLMAFCAKSAVENKFQVLLVSHSEHIISQIEPHKIYNIRWSAGGATINRLNKNSEVFDELGLVPSRKALIICEDEMAKLMICEMIKCSSKYAASEFVFHQAKGDGAAVALASLLPPMISGFRFMCVLDGDCRTSYQTTKSRPICFLPGNKAPEVELIDWFQKLPINEQSQILGKKELEAEAVLQRCIGIDHHEYFLKAASDDHVIAQAIKLRALHHWIDRHQELVAQFLGDLEDAYSPSL